MIHSNLKLCFLAVLLVSSWKTESATADGGTVIDYPECRTKRQTAGNLAEIKAAIIDVVGSRGATVAADRPFANNLVIVAPAELRHGRSDLVAYVSGSRICGTGGCNAYVFEQRPASAGASSSYRLVTKIVPARLPISVLPTSHNGWRDIGVKVAGGGIIPGYTAALSHDGKSYDSNPTLKGIPQVRAGSGEIILGPPGASSKQCRLR